METRRFEWVKQEVVPPALEGVGKEVKDMLNRIERMPRQTTKVLQGLGCKNALARLACEGRVENLSTGKEEAWHIVKK